MYWNICKRNVNTNEFDKIVKTYKCFGRTDWDMWHKANRYCWFRNISRMFQGGYYYKVEFDFE